MIGTLSKAQIDQVLHMQVVGRIGCHADGKMYIVPISYAFDGQHLYAHSKEGLKIDIMRKKPEVCFQVDIIDNMANWRSVLLWGTFEELITPVNKEKATKLLDARFAPLRSSETITRPTTTVHPPQSVEKRIRAVYFRIKVSEREGRFEKSGA